MKRILWLSAICLPAVVMACQAEGDKKVEVSVNEAGEPAAPEMVIDDVTVGYTDDTSRSAKRVEDIVIDPAVMIDGAALSTNDDEGFAMNAFPPMLPETEHHMDAWLRNDCLVCHEEGVVGAPVVRHRGMSRMLLKANCRTCHVFPDADAGPLTNLAGEEIQVFEANAFPPTLPVDDSHSQAWMRKDCLMCHQWGAEGAPKVRHYGMSTLLLEANCRSCHLPGANSAVTDVPQ